MTFSFNTIKTMAEQVRSYDLAMVLTCHGCKQHTIDKAKWDTPKGILSVNGQKFINWTAGAGGGGAIDLVIHLQDMPFKDAVLWLYNNIASTPVPLVTQQYSFVLPRKDDTKMLQVIKYLKVKRRIPEKKINHLIKTGKLYADFRANAVFLLLGKKKKIVGAELRGTSQTKWRGMAPGSQKKSGCFYVIGTSSKKMVLCESAIDAMSCHSLFPEYTAISTSGATADPSWLKNFIANGCEIYCGFDADKTGHKLANEMINLYPSVKRLQPPIHDWNETLQWYSR